MHERRMAGRTGRAVARPGRVARSHVPRVLLAAVALLVVLLQVDTAFALPGSEMNGYPLGEILVSVNVGANRGTAVYGAANEFFATLCLIGRKSDYLQLSSDQLSELSGEGTGGAFYELSQRWSNLAADGAPADWPIGIGLAIEGQGLISDPAYIWYADYSYYESDSLYKRALDDYLTIYNGGHLGGGAVGDYIEFDVDSIGSSVPSRYQGITKVRIPKDKCNLLDLNPNLCVLRLTTFSGIRIQSYTFYIGVGSCTIEPSGSNYSFITPSGSKYGFSNINYNYSTTVEDGILTVVMPDSSFSLSANNNGPRTDTVYSDKNYIICTYSGTGGGGGGGGGTWPEPDPTPEPDPPDVPEPQEPTGPGIDPPNPIGYTIDPTDDPDPVTDPYVVVVAPDSQDIIPWLRAILQAINNLGDKLNDESTELQRALNQVFFTNLSKLLKNLKGEFLQDFTQWLDLELEWMMESIESLFLDLQDYLYDLFQWLADQMNFEFDISTDPYDDTSLLNWLRRIYNKLGADGGPNTRPVDPSTDPEGFLDWLRRMIAEFILGLGASASDFVSDLGDLLSRLFAKFPFSVPWDLLGILGLLDAAPVAPRANFTIPLTIGNQEFNWTVDINLSGWSTYMESVRTIILVSFISWLAWLTPSVLRDLDPGDFI